MHHYLRFPPPRDIYFFVFPGRWWGHASITGTVLRGFAEEDPLSPSIPCSSLCWLSQAQWFKTTQKKNPELSKFSTESSPPDLLGVRASVCDTSGHGVLWTRHIVCELGDKMFNCVSRGHWPALVGHNLSRYYWSEGLCGVPTLSSRKESRGSAE